MRCTLNPFIFSVIFSIMHSIMQYQPLLNWLIVQEYLIYDYADPCAVMINACSIHTPGFMCPTVPLFPCVSFFLYLCNTVFDKNIFWHLITDYGFILTTQISLIVACQLHTGALFNKWTSYRKISWSLGAVRSGCKITVLLWNLTGSSAVSNFRLIGKVLIQILRLWDLSRSCSKKYYCLVNRGPGGRLNKKDGLTRYGNSHVKDKTS